MWKLLIRCSDGHWMEYRGSMWHVYPDEDRCRCRPWNMEKTLKRLNRREQDGTV